MLQKFLSCCCVNRIFFHEFHTFIYLFGFIRWQSPWFIENPWILRALLACEVNGIWLDRRAKLRFGISKAKHQSTHVYTFLEGGIDRMVVALFVYFFCRSMFVSNNETGANLELWDVIQEFNMHGLSWRKGTESKFWEKQ